MGTDKRGRAERVAERACDGCHVLTRVDCLHDVSERVATADVLCDACECELTCDEHDEPDCEPCECENCCAARRTSAQRAQGRRLQAEQREGVQRLRLVGLVGDLEPANDFGEPLWLGNAAEE